MAQHPTKPYQVNLSWIDEPSTRSTDKNGIRRFTEPWEMLLTIHGKRYQIILPEGFYSDGPSIPWIFTWIVPRNDKTEGTGSGHDGIYARRGEFPIKGTDRVLKITRYQADTAFIIGCLKMGLRMWRAALAAAVVHAFGWVAWRNTSETDRRNAAFPIEAIALDD